MELICFKVERGSGKSTWVIKDYLKNPKETILFTNSGKEKIALRKIFNNLTSLYEKCLVPTIVTNIDYFRGRSLENKTVIFDNFFLIGDFENLFLSTLPCNPKKIILYTGIEEADNTWLDKNKANVAYLKKLKHINNFISFKNYLKNEC